MRHNSWLSRDFPHAQFSADVIESLATKVWFIASCSPPVEFFVDEVGYATTKVNYIAHMLKCVLMWQDLLRQELVSLPTRALVCADVAGFAATKVCSITTRALICDDVVGFATTKSMFHRDTCFFGC